MYKAQVSGICHLKPRWAFGWYCEIDGSHYIILDDATIGSDGYGNDVIEGFVEVIPETVEQIGDKP